MTETLTHTGPLWRWAGGNAAWFFVTIDGAAGEALSVTALMRRLESGKRTGWGMIKVEAQLGDSRWATSVFPSKDQGWLLPVKKAIRAAEGIGEGDSVTVELRF